MFTDPCCFQLRNFHDLAQCGSVVGRLQMLNKRLSSDRETFFDHHGRLLTRERIAFQRIARVGEFHLEPIFEVRNKLLQERTKLIKFLFLLRESVPFHA